jgi:hypothetical protein
MAPIRWDLLAFVFPCVAWGVTKSFQLGRGPDYLLVGRLFRVHADPEIPFASGSTLVSHGVKCFCIHVVQDGAAPSIGIHAGLSLLAVSRQSLSPLSRCFFKPIHRSLYCLRAWSCEIDHFHPDAPHCRALGSWLYYTVQYRWGSFHTGDFSSTAIALTPKM